jgi:hypothetical protein
VNTSTTGKSQWHRDQPQSARNCSLLSIFALLDKPHLDKRIEIRVQSLVVDIGLIVGVEFALDHQPVARLLGQNGEDGLLKRGELGATTDVVLSDNA